MRLFIALDLGELSDLFRELQSRLPVDYARMSLPGSFHLTLKFLGEVPEGKVQGILDSLAKIVFKPLDLAVSRVGCFPDIKHPKVVWAGLDDSPALAKLQESINSSLHGFLPEDQPFKPHITLARVKHVDDKTEFAAAITSLEVQPAPIRISSFKLIRSVLSRSGADYEVVKAFSAQ